MKKKIDVEMKIIAEYLKKQLHFYQIRGISFGIDFEPGNTIVLSENLTSKICNYSGILPLFTIEIDRCYKEVTKDENGLPFVYVRDDEAMVERLVEISENIDLSKSAVLTKSLAFLDYAIEERVRNAYIEKYGVNNALKEFENKTPIDIDITDIYTNYEKANRENTLVVYSEPKNERVKVNLNVNKPAKSNTVSNSKTK